MTTVVYRQHGGTAGGDRRICGGAEQLARAAKLAGLVAELGPVARAADVEQAAHEGDVVVMIPLRVYLGVSAEPLAGKLVIDTCNYYPRAQ
jgi:predicted dinucleotide-binding enzyme